MSAHFCSHVRGHVITFDVDAKGAQVISKGVANLPLRHASVIIITGEPESVVYCTNVPVQLVDTVVAYTCAGCETP